MPTRRPATKGAAPAPSSPLTTAALVAVAIGHGLWLLVSGGKVSWPPTALLAGLSTLAGSLALIGPVVLARRDGGSPGLGELAWMTGGLLIWVFDLGALAQSGWRSVSWVSPMNARAMGLTILAVLAAGWRLRGGPGSGPTAAPGARGWSWTNVLGWSLGVFWVAMGLATFAPSRGLGLALR